MTLQASMLNILCPMHVLLDAEGRVVQAGPTLRKIFAEVVLEGDDFLNHFVVYRPRVVDDMAQFLAMEGRKLHLRRRGARRTAFKGLLVADGQGGAVVNLSFGIGVVDAVREFNLTATDFAATDLAVEMLYLVEAKSAAMDASRRLNTRLQGAKLAAEERAFTDTLTGLGNRRALDKALSSLANQGCDYALLQIDLDYFKQVNDTLGHAAGDHVLQSVARVMQQATRKGDTVARVGGDEFVILCPGLTARARLAELAASIIDKIERPVHYQNHRCEISASIGIAVACAGNPDPNLLMQQADEALYAAKNAGRAQYRTFPTTEGRARMEKTQTTAAE